jgi:hypothetical protein
MVQPRRGDVRHEVAVPLPRLVELIGSWRLPVLVEHRRPHVSDS